MPTLPRSASTRGAGRHLLGAEPQAALDALDDAAPAGVDQPVVDRAGVEALLGQEVRHERRQLQLGELGQLARDRHVAVVGVDGEADVVERARRPGARCWRRAPGPGASGVEVEHGRGAAVAEQRRADDLHLRVARAGRTEEAGDALGGDHQRALARAVAQRLVASRSSGTALAQPTPTRWYLSQDGSRP